MKSIDRFTFYTCPIRPLLTSRGAPPPTSMTLPSFPPKEVASALAAPETEPSFIFFGGGASAGSSVGFPFRPPPPLCTPALCTCCIGVRKTQGSTDIGWNYANRFVCTIQAMLRCFSLTVRGKLCAECMLHGGGRERKEALNCVSCACACVRVRVCVCDAAKPGQQHTVQGGCVSRRQARRRRGSRS